MDLTPSVYINVLMDVFLTQCTSGSDPFYSKVFVLSSLLFGVCVCRFVGNTCMCHLSTDVVFLLNHSAKRAKTDGRWVKTCQNLR